MVNWKDPAVIQANAKSFSNVIIVILGLYTWEYLTTLGFEISFFVEPRRKWRIEYVSYFACRYSFLLVMIMLTTLYNLTSRVNCQAMSQTAQVLGNIAIGTATLNILYRASVISRRYGRLLWSALWVAEVGHWGILVWNVFTLESSWNEEASSCNVTYTSRTALVLLYVYTILFDLVILLICIAGLWKHKPKSGTINRQFWGLLRRQGIFYFLTSFTANLFPFIFLVLNLNPVMSSVATIPAACATTIASCRAIVWLTSWAENEGSGLSDQLPDIPLTPSSAAQNRRKVSVKQSAVLRDAEAGVRTVDVGLPSEIFAKTRRNDEDHENAMRSDSDDPSDFKSPSSLQPHSPPHYSPASGAHPVILSLPDGKKGGSSGYYPYDDRPPGGRQRGKSPDSRPSTGDDTEDRPVREIYGVP